MAAECSASRILRLEVESERKIGEFPHGFHQTRLSGTEGDAELARPGTRREFVRGVLQTCRCAGVRAGRDRPSLEVLGMTICKQADCAFAVPALWCGAVEQTACRGRRASGIDAEAVVSTHEAGAVEGAAAVAAHGASGVIRQKVVDTIAEPKRGRLML